MTPKLNYIKLINRFWDVHKRRSLNSNEIALFFFILKESNAFDWENPVPITSALIMDGLGITRNTLTEIRNKLKQASLIQFNTSNGSKHVKYFIMEEDTSYFDKVADKVAHKVADKVADKDTEQVDPKQPNRSLLDNNKPKPKLKEADGLNHVFLEKLFSDTGSADLENLRVQFHVTQIKKNWAQYFNAHLGTEHKQHTDYPTWLKHFRSWLRLQIRNLQFRDGPEKVKPVFNMQNYRHVTDAK